MPTPDAILELTDLSVHYPDGTEALRGVSLAVPAGGRMGLIGPNGSGKTSLLLAVMGGLRFGGSVRVDGIELTRRTADAVRNRCGLAFQDADDQLFMPTLLEDVAFGPLNQGCSPAESADRARSAIEAVALEGLQGRVAHHLSGGQKRNAALATLLSMQVQLLLLDEPTAGLDVRSRRRLIEILSDRPEALLLASHDLEMVAELCDQVAVLEAGQIVAVGPAPAVLADRELLIRHGLAE